MRGFVVSTALLNRITDPDARRRLEEAKVAEPRPEPLSIARPVQADPLDRYRVPRKIVGWRHITVGCASCRQAEPRWLQREIQTPKRFMRLALWFANLLPRAVELWTALVGGCIPWEQFQERQATCSACPDAVIHLRLLEETMREKRYCGACNCPKWWLARLDVKNQLRYWRCPKRRHANSDPDATYRVYVLGKTAEAQRAIVDGGGGDGRATEMTIGSPIRMT